MIDVKRDAVNHLLKDFRGGSGEEKPTENVAPGSTFYEWDTCKGFMFDGEEWLLQTSGGGGGDSKTVYPLGYFDTVANTDSLIPSTEHMFFGSKVTTDGVSPYTGEEVPYIAVSDYICTAGKGDTIYFGYQNYVLGTDSFEIGFCPLDTDLGYALLFSLESSDFADHYTCELTIPEKDLNGNDWGDVPGYIEAAFTGM